MATHYSSPGTPSFLIVPGLNDSGSTHWQTHWLRLLRGAKRAELGDWDLPSRDRWVSRLDEAIRTTSGPIFLVAHSLGCHAVAWWAALQPESAQNRVAGALLVAPPDCDRDGAHPVLQRFSPSPLIRFGFPALLAASQDDPYATIDQSRRLARDWGADFVDTGQLGHINAESGIGHWPAGLSLLGRLLSRSGFGRRAGAAEAPLAPAFTPAPEAALGMAF